MSLPIIRHENRVEQEFKLEFTQPQTSAVCQSLSPAYSTDIKAFGYGVIYLSPPQNIVPFTSTSVSITTLPGYTGQFTAIKVNGFLSIQHIKISQICTLGVSLKVHQNFSGAVQITQPVVQVSTTETSKEVVVSVSNGVLQSVYDVNEDIQYVSQIVHVGSGNCYTFYTNPSSYGIYLIVQDYSQELGTGVGPTTQISFDAGLATQILKSVTGFIKIMSTQGSGQIVLKTLPC